jgi:hypothetical protein
MGLCGVSGGSMDITRKEYFYKLVCPLSKETKYIGRTVCPKNRLSNHLYEAKKNNRNKRERWISSLLDRGLKPEMVIIWNGEITLKDAMKIEKVLIKRYRNKFKIKNGKDHGLGGKVSTKKVYQYDLSGEYINSYINSNHAKIETSIKDCNILRCCNNENGYGTKTAGGFFWSFNKYEKYPHSYNEKWRKEKGKAVVAINVFSGEQYVFKTAREGAVKLNVTHKKISACCLNKQKTTGGYYWKFLD